MYSPKGIQAHSDKQIAAGVLDWILILCGRGAVQAVNYIDYYIFSIEELTSRAEILLIDSKASFGFVYHLPIPDRQLFPDFWFDCWRHVASSMHIPPRLDKKYHLDWSFPVIDVLEDLNLGRPQREGENHFQTLKIRKSSHVLHRAFHLAVGAEIDTGEADLKLAYGLASRLCQSRAESYEIAPSVNAGEVEGIPTIEESGRFLLHDAAYAE